MSKVDSAPAAESVTDPTPRTEDKANKPRSLAGDAWRDLRRNWIFWFASVLVVLVVAIALFPGLFTSADPRDCALSRQHAGPSGGALFGYDFQGCDVYARTIYGARVSVQVGLFATLISGFIGLVIGMIAGYFGGWVDAILSRGIDIVLGIGG
jgi:oligopeptide transport system permease protein